MTAIALLAARDIRSNLGANLKLVQEKSKLDLWMAGMDQLLGALEAADRVEVPQLDSWRPAYLKKLLAQQLQAHYRADTREEERIQTMIVSLVKN